MIVTTAKDTMQTSPERPSFTIEPVLVQRRSPRAYSGTEVLTAEGLGAAFEAARWSPSSGNSQPWSFVVGFRGDDVFDTILGTLASGNAVWAEKASALVANIAQLVSPEGKQRSHAVYDLGQAVAHFSVQATAEGLLVHQMGGFDADALGEQLGLDDAHRVITVMTVGFQGDVADLPENLQERETAPRVRKPLAEIVSGSVSYA
jgi:nitroreductase